MNCENEHRQTDRWRQNARIGEERKAMKGKKKTG